MLWVSLSGSTGANLTDTSALLDIAIGAAASEVVIVPNLAVGYKDGFVPGNSSGLTPTYYAIPVRIPLGSRVAIRCQSAVTVATVAIELTLGNLPTSRLAPTAVVDIGTNLATSQGVTITPSGSNNTKGVWVDITTSTTMPFSALAAGFQGASDTVFGNNGGLVDIGISTDGGTTYVALDGGGDIPIGFRGGSEAVMWAMPILIPCTVPQGVRLAARYQQSAVGNGLDCVLYGIPA